MKKVFITLAAALVAVSLSAQNNVDDLLSELENAVIDESDSTATVSKDPDFFEFNVISYLGLGFHGVNDDHFSGMFQGNSREFLMNLLELDINPVKWLSGTIGLDLRWDRLMPKGNYAYVMDSYQNASIASAPAGQDNFSSRVRTFSLTIPLALEIKVGKVNVRGGAEAVLPTSKKNYVRDQYTVGSTEHTATTYGTAVDSFCCDVFASITVCDFGAYFKYYPKGFFLAGQNYPLTTVGLFIDML